MPRSGSCLTLLFSLGLSLMNLTHAEEARPLTIERLFADPSLSGSAPRALRYAPDGSRISYLKSREDDYDRYDLWEYHIEDATARLLVDSEALVQGEEELSNEEKARRERQRIFGKGIMEYQWTEDSRGVLFPLGGDVYHFDLATKAARRLTATPAFETDVRSSPKGQFVSFVRDQDLFAVDLATGQEKALTQDGDGPIKNGMAEFVAQEEMDRLTGYWWSPDDRHIAYLQVDESPVDLVTRSEIYADRVDIIEQRYPAAGRPNVKLRLGVLELASGETRWVDLGPETDFYLPRVAWANAGALSYQWQSRDQQTLELRRFDLASGQSKTLLTERSETWVNLHDDLHFLDGGARFIWSSERSGYRHLYLYEGDGKLLRQLTAGEWVVDRLEAVVATTGASASSSDATTDDDKNIEVYFTGRRETPTQRFLYRTRLQADGEPQVVSRRAGMHSIEFAADGSSYLDSYSSALTPPQVSLHAPDGSFLTWVEENRVDETHPLFPFRDGLLTPEFSSLDNGSGPALYTRLYKPKGFEQGTQYPAIVHVYGGPGAQVVKDAWSDLFLQYLAQQGYVVFSLDNRGSAARGKAFEEAIYQRMGTVEVDDQRAGVEFLKALPYVDSERVGIYGHSYGGYMALMSLAKAGEDFAAAVAGAPVTDWMLYDTHYTERYMGHPEADSEAYLASSVFPYIDALKKPLLLYHGMADDNVLFTHSTKLMKALQDERKPFELMTYPGKKHSMRGKDTRVHLYSMIADFFDRHLKVTQE